MIEPPEVSCARIETILKPQEILRKIPISADTPTKESFAMSNDVQQLQSQPANTTSGIATEKRPWQRPTLEEFAIAAATRNAGIINLDAGHALDVS